MEFFEALPQGFFENECKKALTLTLRKALTSLGVLGSTKVITA